MKLHQSLKAKVSRIAFIAITVLAPSLYAQDGDPNRLVEVQVAQDHLAPYVDRRETNGMYFGIVYEDFLPSKYVSSVDSKTYKEMFGSDTIPLVGISFDYKYNFSLGSLALGLNGAMGKLSGTQSGEDRSLDVTKYAVSLKYTADNFMPEPYVAPYLGIAMYQISVDDKSPTASQSKTTPMGYAFTVGALLQLDWIDADNAKTGTFNFGLENTFIDLFMTQYAKAGGAEDPNMETDMIWGAGLRLEF